MKNILCYGDSNTWGAAPMGKLTDRGRYDIHTRWAGVLRDELGADYWVIEEGLGGRTTVHSDPIEGEYKNGKTYLMPCLESHRPLDLVIIMLGTNDLKHRFSVTAWDIARSCGVLVDIVHRSNCGVDNQAPQVLLICPPPLGKLTMFADMMKGGTEKSQELAKHYRATAELYGCHFLNAGDHIVSSDFDGIHFDAAEQIKLGKVAAVEVKKILG